MYHFIVNPTASSGKGMAVWKKTERILKREQVEYEAHILKSAGEVTRLVSDLTGHKENSDDGTGLHNTSQTRQENVHLVVLGGDGTLNAVLNGIVSFKRTILSCIRTGSGNDFARNMKVSKSTATALGHLLKNPKEYTLDYGEVFYEPEGSGGFSSRRFLISSGVGYDADICEEVSRSRLKRILNKVHLGEMVYVAIGIRQIFTRKAVNAVLSLDEEDIQVPGLFFVVGMNHEREGGGVPFCPDADPTDGLLDVCLVRDMPAWKLLLAVLLVYGKKHLLFHKVSAYRCQRLTVRTDEPQWFHFDGETPCRVRQVEMECKAGLRFRM